MKTIMRRGSTALVATILLFAGSGLHNDRAISAKSPQRDRTRDAPEPRSKEVRFEAKLERLECDKTTEQAADEVYILVLGKRSDGKQTISERLPSDNPNAASGHWDMNDSGDAADNPDGDSRNVTNKSLFARNLAKGEAWDLVFVFMEEDLGPEGANPLPEVAKAMVATKNVYAIAAGTLASILTKAGILRLHVDSDDYIGAVSLHVENEKGTIKTSWNAVDRVNQRFTFKHAFEYEFNGDGSFYKAWIDTNEWQ